MVDIIHECGYDIRLKGFDGKIIENYITPQGQSYIRAYENIYLTRRPKNETLDSAQSNKGKEQLNFNPADETASNLN